MALRALLVLALLASSFYPAINSRETNSLQPIWVTYYGGEQSEFGRRIIQDGGSLYVLG